MAQTTDGAERGCRPKWTDGSFRDVTCSSKFIAKLDTVRREIAESPPPELKYFKRLQLDQD
jgi:hypothetical protein